VLLGLLTSVVSIYYYVRVIRMMVVKEPQEMSDAVKNYPEVRWDQFGLRPLQVGIVVSLIVTSLAGILSNPLFTLSNSSVQQLPTLQAGTTTTAQVAPAPRS
jgi:NAD(P)H-quinone oxidoreductase subunit 2